MLRASVWKLGRQPTLELHRSRALLLFSPEIKDPPPSFVFFSFFKLGRERTNLLASQQHLRERNRGLQCSQWQKIRSRNRLTFSLILENSKTKRTLSLSLFVKKQKFVFPGWTFCSVKCLSYVVRVCLCVCVFIWTWPINFFSIFRPTHQKIENLYGLVLLLLI